MEHQLSDELMEHIGILAKLDLSGEEKEKARLDMGRMLDYVSRLKEVDTEGVEPPSHVFPVCNVFREDTITHADGRESILANAPRQRDGAFIVPTTIVP